MHEAAWEVFAAGFISNARPRFYAMAQHLEEYLNVKAVWIKTG